MSASAPTGTRRIERGNPPPLTWCGRSATRASPGRFRATGLLRSAIAKLTRATTIDSPLLQVDNVSVRFGGIVALDRVSFQVSPGHIVGLIGPNGAGKTTLFNCLSRLYAFSEGRIAFEGRSLLETPAHGIAALGIGRTFQNLALFRTMSVRENVMVGGHVRTRTGYVANALRLPAVRREESRLGATADRLLALLDLGAVADVPVMDLPFGTQKRVELGRALASEPKLLLLDEPAAGLDTTESQLLGAHLRSFLASGTSIFLIDHDMGLVLNVCDDIYVLDFGKIIAHGTPNEIRKDPAVITAYLGQSAGEAQAREGAELAAAREATS